MNLDQWETFYRSGLLATGPAGADGLYDLEIRGVWDAFFEELPAGGRLLDIGTGNGVLPLMALQAARKRGIQLRIDATDLARIDPRRFVPEGGRRFEDICFHPGVANERLPFDSAVFDGATGQYALEYGDRAASIAELARVLKIGAPAQFVLHHASSELVLAARRSMQECDLIFKQTRLYRKLHRLVSTEHPSQDSLRRSQAELSTAIREVRAALSGIEASNNGGGRILAVALDATQKLLAARRSMRGQTVGLEVDRAEQELRTAWRRLDDLCSHASDEQQMQRLEVDAAQAGFQLMERRPLLHNGVNLVGWLLRLRRS